MPIIYTYPSVTPASGDLLLISDVSETDPEKATRTCTVGDIVSLVTALVPGGGTVTSVTLDFQTTGLTTGGGSSETITTTGTFDIAGTLVAANGGTGQSSYAVGDILYASGATALSKLTAGTNTHVLTLAGGVPTWAAPTTGSVTSVNASGGTTGITFSGGPITTTGTLTMGGTLVVANGGTGATTLADHGILLGSGTSPITATAAPTVGQILVGVNATSDPVLSRLQAGAGMSIDDTSVPGQITLSSSAAGMNSFTLAGSAGVNQTVTDGNTVTIEAGANISTTGAATDKVTVAWVAPTKTAYDTQLGLSGSTSGLLLAAAFTTNLASYYQIGEKMYIEFYLEWTSAAGAALVGNLILTGLPIAAYQTGAAIDNGNCVIHLNDNLGRSAGNEAPTTGWVAKSGVSREMTFRSCDSTTHIFEDYNYDQRLVEGSPAYKLAGTITYMTA